FAIHDDKGTNVFISRKTYNHLIGVGGHDTGELRNAHQTFLDRKVDVLSQAVRKAGKQGTKRGYGRVHAGLESGLLTESFQGRKMLAAHPSTAAIAKPSRVPQREVHGLVVLLWSAQPKRGNGSHHQPRVKRRQAFIV